MLIYKADSESDAGKIAEKIGRLMDKKYDEKIDFEYDNAKDVFPKIKKILITTDGKASTKNSIDYGIKLAKDSGAKLHTIYVIDTANFALIPMDAAWETIYDEAINYVIRKAKSEGLEVITDILEGHPAEKIIKYAEGNSIDLIVMGTAQKGLDRFLLGSVSEKVVRSSKIPVLLVPESKELREEHIPDKKFNDILIATYGLVYTKKAIDYGIELAKNAKATLYALHVIDISDNPDPDGFMEVFEKHGKQKGKEITQYVVDGAQAEGLEVITDILVGYPAEKIMKYAENNSVDIIVMGTLGKRGLARFGVAEKVARSSKIPVLVARGKTCDMEKMRAEDEGLAILWVIFSCFWFIFLLLLIKLYSHDLPTKEPGTFLVALPFLLGFITAMWVYRRHKK